MIGPVTALTRKCTRTKMHRLFHEDDRNIPQFIKDTLQRRGLFSKARRTAMLSVLAEENFTQYRSVAVMSIKDRLTLERIRPIYSQQKETNDIENSLFLEALAIVAKSIPNLRERFEFIRKECECQSISPKTAIRVFFEVSGKSNAFEAIAETDNKKLLSDAFKVLEEYVKNEDPITRAVIAYSVASSIIGTDKAYEAYSVSTQSGKKNS